MISFNNELSNFIISFLDLDRNWRVAQISINQFLPRLCTMGSSQYLRGFRDLCYLHLTVVGMLCMQIAIQTLTQFQGSSRKAVSRFGGPH